MPRTRAELEKAAAETEAWLDSLDPDSLAPAEEMADLRAIGEALTAEIAADRALHEAVAAARANGRTWAEIGMVLGVTRQTAQQRFGRPARV